MRFYLPQIDTAHPELTGDAHTHAAYSLRSRVGDFITVFDGRGTEYSCRITDIKKDRTCLDIIDTTENAGEPSVSVSLYMSVIKQDRFELAVQKVTELGVASVTPVYSQYTQRSVSLNYERLNKIAIAACEQCGRSRVPVIENAIEFDALVERAKNSYLIFPWEREMTGKLNDAIDPARKELSVFIGPEGGITETEKNRLTEVGAKSVTLGKRILRAETAAISTLSVIYYEMGEWKL